MGEIVADQDAPADGVNRILGASVDDFIRIITGRPNEVVVDADPELVILEGRLLDGEGRPAGDYPFLLRRGGEAGTRVTPDGLAGKTGNRFDKGWWWTDAQGKYRFENVPKADWWVEAWTHAGPPAPEQPQSSHQLYVDGTPIAENQTNHLTCWSDSDTLEPGTELPTGVVV